MAVLCRFRTISAAVSAAVLAAAEQSNSNAVEFVAELATIAAGFLLLSLGVVTVCFSGLRIRSFCCSRTAALNRSIADELARSFARLR